MSLTSHLVFCEINSAVLSSALGNLHHVATETSRQLLPHRPSIGADKLAGGGFLLLGLPTGGLVLVSLMAPWKPETTPVLNTLPPAGLSSRRDEEDDGKGRCACT